MATSTASKLTGGISASPRGPHNAEAAQAGGAALAVPLQLIVFVDVIQVERAAVFQYLPIGRVRLALEALRMEDSGGAVAVVGMAAHMDV